MLGCIEGVVLYHYLVIVLLICGFLWYEWERKNELLMVMVIIFLSSLRLWLENIG